VKKRRRKSPEGLPLDSPNWVPIGEAYRLLCGRIGGPGFVVKEFTEAMRDGRVPSMRRCFAYGLRRAETPSGELSGYKRVLIGPDRELLPRAHWNWNEHWLSPRSDSVVQVYEGHGSIRSVNKEYEYFVWKPALEKVWPVLASVPTAAAAAPSEQADNLTPRRRPGPKPTEDWPTLVAAWLVAEALKTPEKFPRRNLINVDSLVEEAAAFLQKQERWAPKDDKALRAYILSYLRYVRP
jgi:hypothetical protein